MAPLAFQLAVATAVVSATVLLHLAGLLGMLRLLRVHARLWMTPHARLNQVLMILGAAFGLFVLHAAEIWLYAGLYTAAGALPDFETGLYFSTSSYATMGYGDVVLTRGWRLVGAIEGANGVILLGWSTAFFVSIVQKLRTLEHDWIAPAPPVGRPRA